MKSNFITKTFLLMLPLALVSCQSQPTADVIAEVTLQPRSKSEVSGTVTFLKSDPGFRVVTKVKGLTAAEHGFHIHEKGDCSAPDASSAGAHLNPHKKKHSSPSKDSHLGDLGNIPASGEVTLEIPYVTPAEFEAKALGKAVIIHEKKDDLSSQPAGNAGARIACGVIEKKGS